MADTELTLPSSDGAWEGRIVGEQYHLKASLSRTRQGPVFEATSATGKRVAVKMLSESTDSSHVERLHREVAAISTIRGPHVVACLDHGVDTPTGVPFIVMPLLQGRTLQDAVAAQGVLGSSAVVRIAYQVARALETIHAVGAVHGNVKPSNVLLEGQEGGTIAVCLADFGMARVRDDLALWAATQRIPSPPAILSPEQAAGPSQGTARSDLWSLGATLYWALAGRATVDTTATYGEQVSQLTIQDPPSLSVVAPTTDTVLAAAVSSLLVRNPNERCPSAGQFLDALRALESAPTPLTEDVLTAGPDQNALAATVRPDTESDSWESIASSVPEDASAAMVGELLAERFELTRLLGVGGMGAVYQSTTEDGKQVAIKLIRPDVATHGPQVMKRFVREARSYSKIQSENVVTVLETGTDQQRQLPFIVMELLVGQDLGRLTETQGAIAPAVAARIFHDACLGLAVAHDLGMVHRDIKPENVFLHEGASGLVVPKVCDFGIAKQDINLETHAGTQLTQTGGMLGSPMYMAPEQAVNAKRADARSDVWSVGASLFEVLSGREPWCGCSTIGELLLALYTRDFDLLQDAAPWIEPELAEVVHRALVREPDDRYQTAAEFAEALAPFITAEPLTLDSLAPLSDSRRSQVAIKVRGSTQMPRSTTAPGTGIVDEVTTQSATSDVEKPPSAKRALMVTAGAVLSMVAAAAVIAVKQPTVAPDPPGPETTAATAAPSSAAPEPISASLEVKPKDAEVTVDGKSVELVDGKIAIQRAPGVVVLVVLKKGDLRKEQRVVVTSDGAIPPAVEIDTPPVKISATPPTTQPPIPTGGPVNTPPPTKPAPTKPPPTGTGEEPPPPIDFQKTW